MEFIWDEGNITKSSQKHGIFPLQAMSIFKDKNAIIFPDEKHSAEEQRYNIVGRDIEGIILFAYFTVRNGKIRIIGCRKASKKEREKYTSQFL